MRALLPSHRIRRPGRRAGMAGGVALTLAAALVTTGVPAAQAAEWDGRLVLDTGHVDAVHLTVADGELQLLLREDVTGDHVVHDPDDVVLHVTDAARFSVPDVPGFEFLGPPGSDTWLIPEVQNPDVVWAGWDTEDIPDGTLRGNTSTITLSDVSGPGTVHIFGNGPVGEPIMRFDPQNGPRSIEMPTGPGNHSHADWAFSARGVYDLTFTANAVLADGTPVEASGTYRFVVGPLPNDPTDPTDPPGPGAVSQEIQASIGAGAGSLVLSVDPDDRSVVLPEAVLAPSGDRWRSTGELRPVRVTDTRSGSPGWNVTGRVGGFSGAAGEMDASALGWTPLVSAQPQAGGVVAGAPVPAGVGAGLGASSTLASAAAGDGRGSSVLGAGVALSAPAGTEPGAYTATLTLTVI